MALNKDFYEPVIFQNIDTIQWLKFRSMNILDGIENEIKLCVSSHTSFKYTNRKSTIYKEAIKQFMRTDRT